MENKVHAPEIAMKNSEKHVCKRKTKLIIINLNYLTAINVDISAVGLSIVIALANLLVT